MPDHGPLLVGDLIERSHPLNRGRVAWWLAIPHLSGSTLWYDPVGRNPAALLDLSTSNGWRSTSRPGGFGEVSFANTLGALSADTLRHGIGTGDFTIAAWIRPDSLGGYLEAVVTFGQYSPCLYAALSSGQFGFYHGADYPSGTTLTTGVWTRVAGVRRNGTLVYYKDGKQTPTTAGSFPSVADARVMIGREDTASTTGAPSAFAGSIDDVTVYNRGWSDADAQSDYDLSRAGYPGVLRRVPRLYVSTQAVVGSATLFRRPRGLRTGSRGVA